MRGIGGLLERIGSGRTGGRDRSLVVPEALVETFRIPMPAEWSDRAWKAGSIAPAVDVVLTERAYVSADWAVPGFRRTRCGESAG